MNRVAKGTRPRRYRTGEPRTLSRQDLRHELAICNTTPPAWTRPR